MRVKFLALALAGTLMLAACSEGTSRQSLREAAGVTATPQTSPTIAPPQPTETPDMLPRPTAQPAQVIEVTREVLATVEVTRETVQLVEVTPQPTEMPACDPRTPAPTVALDESDQAAGVVLRSHWNCYEVRP